MLQNLHNQKAHASEHIEKKETTALSMAIDPWLHSSKCRLRSISVTFTAAIKFQCSHFCHFASSRWRWWGVEKCQKKVHSPKNHGLASPKTEPQREMTPWWGNILENEMTPYEERLGTVKKNTFKTQKKTGWWFQTFFIFTPTWGKIPKLTTVIFFKGVETTN